MSIFTKLITVNLPHSPDEGAPSPEQIRDIFVNALRANARARGYKCTLGSILGACELISLETREGQLNVWYNSHEDNS